MSFFSVLVSFLVFRISEFPSNLIEQCSMNTQIQMQIQTQTSLERPGKLSSAHRKKLLPVTYTKKILGFVGQQFVTIFEHQLLSSLITVGKRQKGQHIPVRGQVFITQFPQFHRIVRSTCIVSFSQTMRFTLSDWPSLPPLGIRQQTMCFVPFPLTPCYNFMTETPGKDKYKYPQRKCSPSYSTPGQISPRL